MSENLYQAPAADVRTEVETASLFYVVSLKKFLILFITTSGVYQVYWFYKQWKCYSQASQEKMMPILRAIFMIFFTHALYNVMCSKAREIDETYDWKSGTHASICVLLLLLSTLASRLEFNYTGTPWLNFVGVVVFPVIGWTMYHAQKCANFACGDSSGKQNDQLTALNYMWLALGVVYWMLIVVGLVEIVSEAPTT